MFDSTKWEGHSKKEIEMNQIKWKREKSTEILGSPPEVSKMFLAARSRWIILCLWRW
jgi:hypothetical protein